MFVCPNIVSFFVSYVSVSITTIVLPLSDRRILIVLFSFSVVIAFCFSVVILLCGSFVDLNSPATEFLISAFCPFSLSFWHASSVAKIYSSYGIFLGVTAKLTAMVNNSDK